MARGCGESGVVRVLCVIPIPIPFPILEGIRPVGDDVYMCSSPKRIDIQYFTVERMFIPSDLWSPLHAKMLTFLLRLTRSPKMYVALAEVSNLSIAYSSELAGINKNLGEAWLALFRIQAYANYLN